MESRGGIALWEASKPRTLALKPLGLGRQGVHPCISQRLLQVSSAFSRLAAAFLTPAAAESSLSVDDRLPVRLAFGEAFLVESQDRLTRWEEPAAASAYVLPGVVPDGLASGCSGCTEPVEVPNSLAKGVSHDRHTSRVVQLYAWHFWHLISINVGVALSLLGLRLGFRLAGPSEGV